MKRFACVLAVLAICCISQLNGSRLLPPQAVRAQAGEAAYCIWDIDAHEFPVVHLKLRALDDAQQLSGGQSTPQFFENAKLADSAQLVETDGPLAVVFVIDSGRSIGKPQKDAIRRAIGRFADRVGFVDREDASQIRMLSNTTSRNPSSDSIVVMAWTDSKAAINSFTATDFFPTKITGPSKGLEALDKAMSDLKNKVGSPVQQAAIIVFITQRIEAFNGNAAIDASNWANLLKREHIPVYAFQTDGSARSTDVVKTLVGDPARHVVLAGPFDPLVDALYETIAKHRKYYSVTFTSKLNTVDPRIVTFSDPGGRGVAACRGEGHDTYTFLAADPKIEFDNLPRPFVFGVNAQSNTVRVRLKWPPEVTVRKLARAQLLVDDVSKAEGNITSDFERVDFELQASDFGSKTKAKLQVLLTDSANREIRSEEQDVLIEQEAAVATAIPAPPVIVNQGNPAATVATTLGVLAVLGLAGGGGYYLWRRRKNPQNSGGWRANTSGLASQVAVSLTVLEGPHGRKGEKIKLSKNSTVIGRQDADITFYRDSETSTISRKHCTITRDKDVSFWITDNVSSNGTQIIRGGRNQPVLPNERSALLSGDQILLGDLRRNGVLLQFTSDNPTQVVRGRSVRQ